MAYLRKESSQNQTIVPGCNRSQIESQFAAEGVKRMQNTLLDNFLKFEVWLLKMTSAIFRKFSQGKEYAKLEIYRVRNECQRWLLLLTPLE